MDAPSNPTTMEGCCAAAFPTICYPSSSAGYIFVGLPFLYTFGGEDKNALLPK